MTRRLGADGEAAAAAVLGLLPAASRASFVVRPFSHYESSEPEPGSAAGVRRYRHHEQHVLEDGASIEVRWQVDTDPTTIMPVDLHHGSGARVLHCSATQLVLQLPEQHAMCAHDWQHVTASPHVHGCYHLGDKDLYHRGVKVEDVQPIAKHPERHHTVRLTTQELKAATDVFPNSQVSFSFNPARPWSRRPDATSGQHYHLEAQDAHHLEALEEPGWPASRRLGSLASMKYNKPKVSESSSLQPTESHVESILNLRAPKQLSNLSWNWNYAANSTKNPTFLYRFPGGNGAMRLFKPYLIADFTLHINYSSAIKGISKAPHVIIRSKINGTANINVDIATAVNFSQPKGAGVINNVVRKFIELMPKSAVDTYEKSPLQNLFINPLRLDMGGTPFTIQPTFNTKLKAYHLGLMEGSLRVGLATQLELSGLVTFDTEMGMQTNFTAKALNVNFTPPNWMIFTEAFELGMMLEPELCMQASFTDMEDASMCFSFRPYLNVSIQEEGADASSLLAAGDVGASGTSELSIYPYRAVGLPAGKDYSIVVTANGVTKNTSLQMSTGVSEYFDDVSNFVFGAMDESQMVGQQIQVSLLENGVGSPVGSATANCNSVVNGLCHPDPVVANFQVEGQDVQVEMAVVVASNPTSRLRAQTRSISLRFPTVTATGSVAEKLKEPGALNGTSLVLSRNGRSFNVPLTSKMQSTMLLEGNTIFELGPSFLGLWKFPAASSSRGDSSSILTPKLELVIGGQTVGTGNMPPVAWDSTDLSGDSSADFATLSAQAKQQSKVMPVMIPISDSNGQIVGTGQLEIDILPPSKSAFWVQPGVASFFTVGQMEYFSWAVSGGQEDTTYDFSLEALEVDNKGGLASTGWKKDISAQCTVNASAAKEQLQRYTAGETPCMFMYKIKIPDSLANHHVVMVAGWKDSGSRYHEMLSAPVEFVNPGDPMSTPTPAPARRLGDGRRLSQEASTNSSAGDSGDKGTWGIKSLGNGGGPGDYGEQIKQWGANLKAKACDAKPLKYAVGAGMTFIERWENILMPMTMPMLGESPSPDWTSEPVSVWKMGQNADPQKGKSLGDLLPKSVCAGGVCQGMMPGCRKTQVNPITIRQIVFKLKRSFNWTGSNGTAGKAGLPMGPKTRHALAYALALLPSALQVANQQAAKQVASAGTRLLHQQSAEAKKGVTLSEAVKSMWSSASRRLGLAGEEAEEPPRFAAPSARQPPPGCHDDGRGSGRCRDPRRRVEPCLRGRLDGGLVAKHSGRGPY